jgi:uncharacterized protein YrzB (UPF0473 family)
MSATGFPGVTPVSTLRDTFGRELELFDEQGESTVYRIVTEFLLDGRMYAALQNEALRKEHEVAIFRVYAKPGGEPELETIEDDDEWETVSEIVDDLMFPSNE